jgi:hypothetical protein
LTAFVGALVAALDTGASTGAGTSCVIVVVFSWQANKQSRASSKEFLMTGLSSKSVAIVYGNCHFVKLFIADKLVRKCFFSIVSQKYYDT